MTGSIERRGRSSWRLRAYVGRIDGRKVWAGRTVRGSRADAEAELVRFVAEVDAARPPAPPRRPPTRCVAPRPRQPSRRLPLAPLEEIVEHVTVGQLAEQLGVTTRTVHRWRLEGVPMPATDTVAIRVGLHPLIVWGDQWEALTTA